MNIKLGVSSFRSAVNYLNINKTARGISVLLLLPVLLVFSGASSWRYEGVVLKVLIHFPVYFPPFSDMDPSDQILQPPPHLLPSLPKTQV